jgi:hypothetical protein
MARGQIRLRLVLLGALTAAAACFSPRQPACAFSCAKDGQCPTSYACGSDGLCHRQEQGADVGVCLLDPVDAGQDGVDGGQD